jgi:hypothetical protein
LGVIDGVGPDAKIVTKANGYRTSDVPYAMHLMPGAALLHMSNIMCEGAKTHGENNWKNGSVDDHINKLLVHAFAYLAGDDSDDHLGHLAWRGMAALEIAIQDKRKAEAEADRGDGFPSDSAQSGGADGATSRCVV